MNHGLVYGYDFETEVQSSQWVGQRSPSPKQALQSSIEFQGDVDSFFNAKGVVQHNYLPQGSTVNQIYYIEALKRLRDAARCKRTELWRGDIWFSITTTLQPT